MYWKKYYLPALIIHTLMWLSIFYSYNTLTFSSPLLQTLSLIVICFFTGLAAASTLVNITETDSNNFEKYSMPKTLVYNISTYGIAVALMGLTWWFSATICCFAAVTDNIVRYNYIRSSYYNDYLSRNRKSDDNTTL